jgi:hypothetical protein
MSAEDLGMRELGQVRSQRLDEVSFLFFFCLCFSTIAFLFFYSIFSILWLLMRKMVYTAS